MKILVLCAAVFALSACNKYVKIEGDPVAQTLPVRVTSVGGCKVLRCNVSVNSQKAIFGSDWGPKSDKQRTQLVRLHIGDRTLDGWTGGVGSRGRSAFIFFDETIDDRKELESLLGKTGTVDLFNFTNRPFG